MLPRSIPDRFHSFMKWIRIHNNGKTEKKRGGGKESKNKQGEELRQNLILRAGKDILSPNLYGTCEKKYHYGKKGGGGEEYDL